MNIISEITKPLVTKTVVIYAGRFQPFHKGHYDAYKRLVSKFGQDSVYIGTSNDTNDSKSPFNFNEKKKIATTMFGIPSNHFVQIRNPYKPVEILQHFDGQTTQYIAAVGAKDATRLQGKYFKPYNGKAGYGYNEIGYVWPVPAESNPISGTDVRNGLGGDEESAKKFFLKAYPKFNKQIFTMITDKIKSLHEAAPMVGAGEAGSFGLNPTRYDDDDVTEDGFPGGVGVGLTLPGGYINGAPNPKDVKKLSKKIHTTDSNKKYVYDPISEIIANAVTEEAFNEFISNYLNEAEPNKALDQDITYKNTKGQSKKIKARDALRLPKDHPAHIQAAKIAAPAAPAAKTAGKPDVSIPGKVAGSVVKKSDGKPDITIPGKDGKPKQQGPPPPPPMPPKKLSGAELKSNAEMAPGEKEASKKNDEIKASLDHEMSKLSTDDKKSVESVNNPDSPERKDMAEKSKSFLSKVGNKLWSGAKHWANEKKEMCQGVGAAIKTLATGGKLGSVKDANGKYVHHTDFKNKTVQIDPKTAKEKTVWVDKSDLTPEEKKLKHKSEHEEHHQKHSLKHAAKDIALLAASLVAGAAIGGAVGGGIAAAKAGAAHGLGHAIGHGAAHGVSAIAHHGATGIASHVGKDLIKHSAFEAMGLKGHHAAGATAAVGAIGHLMEGDDNNENDNDKNAKLVDTLLKRTMEVMATYKMSDEELLKSIKNYNKNSEKNTAKDILKTINESVTLEKAKNIQDFVDYACERLKLKDKPKVKLLLDGEYSNAVSSLGGYSPVTKDIYVVVPGRMTADICRTIAHELVHRKQDEMGMLRTENDGDTGSPIENQANAVAGILLRDYGKKNKAIYMESVKYINEVSNNTGDDGQPDGGYLPAGHRRTLGANDGVNKGDDWFTGGGYLQLDYPIADAIYGADEENMYTVKYVARKLRRSIGIDTKFEKSEEKAIDVTQDKKNGKLTDETNSKRNLTEVSKRDIHFKNIFQHYRDGDAKMKQKIAAIITGNAYAKIKEILKDIMEMGHNEVEEIEDQIGISLSETIKKVGSKYIVYPKKGGKRLGTHSTYKSAKKQLAAIEINKESSEADGYYGSGASRWDDDTHYKNENITINNKRANTFRTIEEAFDSFYDKMIEENTYEIPTINGKQAITFRKLDEANDILGAISQDGGSTTVKMPYSKKWEEFDDTADKLSDIIGWKRLHHPSDSYEYYRKNLVIPTFNRSEENGKGKRWMHPTKSKEYAEHKKRTWEVWPFNNREEPYNEDHGQVYKIRRNAYVEPTIIKSIKENINESKLLLEGGAYGHMSHPFDDMDLTFGDLKNIISKALDGDLGVVREKTDGQALAISWKNGRLIAARNKGHLQNAGANAMGIEEVAAKFAGRGGLTDAYNFAMRDLSAAIAGLTKAQRDKIFNEGKCFMNIEVIWPTSVNVIPYGQALLVFHNTTCYDVSGTAISGEQTTARMLAGMIKQINADVQSKYTIQGPPITEIPKNQNLSSLKPKYFSKLSKLQNEFGLTDNDTISLYHQSWWENFINKKAPVKVDKMTKEALVRRWAFGDKTFKINTISNAELQKWALNTDKVNVAKQQKDNIRPFEEIFLGVGADILSFVGSVLTVHPDKAIRNMKDRLKATAEQVRTAGSPAQIQKLKTELQRLNNLGGIDKIVASEGLVFFYNGKTYKLTGTFAPLNQILGIFYE